jgi:transcription elongation factor GreA
MVQAEIIARRAGLEYKTYHVTLEGMQRLKDRLDYIQNVHLPRLQAEMRQSMEEAPGSLDDNTGYLVGQEEYEMVESLAQNLQFIVEHAEVVRQDGATIGAVQAGSRVTLLDQDGRQASYQVVDGMELNPGRKDQVSSDSPVGRSLLGKRHGDEVQVTVPDGARRFTVVRVE